MPGSSVFPRDIDRPRAHCAAVALAATILLAACGGGGGGGGDAGPAGTPPLTKPISGSVSAPGGQLAFNAPTGLKRFFAEVFGRNAFAALTGTTAVGAGVTVTLFQIDGSGAKVGADIASTVTDAAGKFTLDVPVSFTPGPSYVIRATGSLILERLVLGAEGQDVDPASDVTKALVITQLAGGSIQTLKTSQVEEIGNRVAGLANNLGGTFGSIAAFTAALNTEAANSQEIQSFVSNATAIYGIGGTVTDSGGALLKNIKIVVRDFSQQTRRAETHTDEFGKYALNIAIGDYIVGAFNFTTTSMAASEWWTCDDTAGGPCGAAIQNSARKVTVGLGITTANFKLEPGARVQGSIISKTTLKELPGVELLVRDFNSSQGVLSSGAQADGSFVVNVRPGAYSLSARNRTSLPYAGAFYDGPAGGGSTSAGGGAAHFNEATRVPVAQGDSITANFALVEGGLVQGQVTDGTVAANAVAGISVRFSRTNIPLGDTSGAFVEGVPTDLAGKYRMWVQPGTYAVRSRGQTGTPTVVASGNHQVDFTAAVGHATVRVQGPDGVPISEVNVLVHDTSNNLLGNERTLSDGSADIFAATGASYRIQYHVDNGSTTVGSITHDGKLAPLSPTTNVLASALPVTFDAASATTPFDLGTIRLPAGGELNGTVNLGTVPTGNVIVQVRLGGFGSGVRTVNTRTSADGTYSVSIPAATYTRVCAFVVGVGGGNACPNQATPSSPNQFGSVDGVVVTAGASTAPVDITIPTQ